MLTLDGIDRFVDRSRDQPLAEGTRYAREARVMPFIGTGESVSTCVRGRGDDYAVALWTEQGDLAWRCTCPSWRDPCKHVVAAALVLRQDLHSDGRPLEDDQGEDDDPEREGLRRADPAEARREALKERRVSARREKLQVRRGGGAHLEVRSPSGFACEVTVRGGPDGPHGCTCPDFEANRLHTCKHVERARAFLSAPRVRLGPAFRRAAARPRIYLHFGEVVEPRLLGRPTGRGSRRVRAAFDAEGVPRSELRPDAGDLLAWLVDFGAWVEPEARAWLEVRVRRRPELPKRPLRRLLPRTDLEPYDYQLEGIEFLARAGRALLADEMGLGKTVQAILAATVLRHATRPVRRTTIICPASLRAGWRDEIERWTGEQAVFVEGSRPKRREIIEKGAPWLITHYEQVLRDHADHARNAPELLIVDEAQRVKGLRAKTARALKSIETPYIFALTGTPLENRLEEAYAISQLIDQRLLPPLWQIDRDHFVRDPKGRSVVMYSNLGSLRSRLAPAFLRRKKEDVELELPERIRSIVKVPLTGLARDEHDEKTGLVARILSKPVILPADLDRMQKLLVIARRCCDGPHMLGVKTPDHRVPKLKELEHALRELCLDEGRKVVVFSEWKDMTKRVEKLCRKLGITCIYLHGGVPVKRRPALLRALETHVGPLVFLSTDAGGVGLNLQAADAVIILDLPWNPARLEQRIARVHRIGSKKPVRILLIVGKDCIEDRILALHDTKRDVMENIWAADGEDEIAAPGGSGAFKAMVQALLERAPLPATMTAAQAGNGHAGQAADARDPDARDPDPSPVVRRPDVSGGKRPERAGSSPPVPVPPIPAPVPPEVTSPVGLDLEALGLAVAQVAPRLPPDHRKSHATVFRALAAALE